MLAAGACALAACEAQRKGQSAGCPADGDGIAVVDAWTPEGAGTVAAAYLTICNRSNTDDALIGVASPDAKAAELHATSRDDEGVVRMEPLERLVLPAGAGVSLKPGETHVMLIGVEPDAGSVELTLTFENGPPLTVELERRTRTDGRARR
jgi:hypothetical protein